LIAKSSLKQVVAEVFAKTISPKGDMAATTAKWTIEDYHHMIEAGILVNRRVELIQGEIVEMAPEGTSHAAYSQAAGDYLRSVLGSRAKIREAKPITLLNTSSEPEPDIAIVVPHPIEVYLQHYPYPEDIFWLIECSDSSLNQDLEDKSQIYAAAGITEYWVMNLKAMELTVLRSPAAGVYESKTIFATGTIAPLGFPDLLVSIDQLVNHRLGQ
jgi:Uma2 family endonuclease